jgi:hypothetical protein
MSAEHVAASRCGSEHGGPHRVEVIVAIHEYQPRGWIELVRFDIQQGNWIAEIAAPLETRRPG